MLQYPLGLSIHEAIKLVLVYSAGLRPFPEHHRHWGFPRADETEKRGLKQILSLRIRSDAMLFFRLGATNLGYNLPVEMVCIADNLLN